MRICVQLVAMDYKLCQLEIALQTCSLLCNICETSQKFITLPCPQFERSSRQIQTYFLIKHHNRAMYFPATSPIGLFRQEEFSNIAFFTVGIYGNMRFVISQICSVKFGNTLCYGQVHSPRMVKKKPKSYSGEHTPSFAELCKLHAIEPLIVMATSQECTLSDYEFINLVIA